MGNRQVVVEIAGDASKFNKATQTATQKGGAFGNVMKGVAMGAGIGVFNAALGVASGAVSWFGDSLTKGSDQVEALGKVTVIFGDQAKAMEDWASTAATSMGMSKTAALGAVGTYGNLFKAMGIGDKVNEDMSKSLVGLAGDLGSFNNMDPTAGAAPAPDPAISGIPSNAKLATGYMQAWSDGSQNVANYLQVVQTQSGTNDVACRVQAGSTTGHDIVTLQFTCGVVQSSGAKICLIRSPVSVALLTYSAVRYRLLGTGTVRMTTYDQAAVTYDDPATLYDGISLGDDATLIVNGEDVTDYLAAGSLSVHVGTQGNSLGTLDAKLNDPASVPALDAQVDMYAGTVRLFRGDSKAVNTDEYRGGHLFVTLSAQDTGPDGSNPTAAPFGLSDAPNGSTTFGYESLRALSRTTEGGSPKTTYQASYRGAGLWAGMNVEITSTNHGLSADEFTVVEATLQYPARNAPLYLLTLGDPIVKLAQIIADGELIPDGAITSTKISDGAISTPKLAANAVTAAKIEAGTITATEIASGAITSAKFATAAQAPGVLNSTGYVEIDTLAWPLPTVP